MALPRTVRDLHRRKARERRGLALAEGVRVVEEMVASRVPCKGALVSPALASTERGRALRGLMAGAGIMVEELDDRELAEAAATEHPQGVVAVYQPQLHPASSILPKPGEPVLVLDALQDPGNVGTIIRTALAFGAAGILALPGTVDLHNPKVVRSSAGAVFRLPASEVSEDELSQWLGETGASLHVTAMTGEPPVASPGAAIAMVLGNEGAGVRNPLIERADRLVSIPISPQVESLNVAVAAGIILHELTSVRRAG